MDWRVFARTDRYYLKEYEAETNLRANFALDCSGSMSFGDTISKFEFSKKLLCTLAYLYVGRGDAVGYTQSDTEKPCFTSQETLPRYKKFLILQAPSNQKAKLALFHRYMKLLKRCECVLQYSSFPIC